MNHDEIKDSIAAYCLGALDSEEKKILEAHLESGCPECEAILSEMQNVVTALPFSAPEQSPPSHVKEQILASIQEKQASATSVIAEMTPGIEERTVRLLERAKRSWMRVSLALSFAIVVIVVSLGWYTNALQKKIKVLENQMLISDRLVRELQTELINKERIIKIVNSPDIRIVDLKGLETAPSSKGKVFWDPVQHKAIFYAFNLPQPPSDKDYQLWILRGNQPIDAGVFSTDAEGAAVSTIDTIADSANLSAFAVTLEPKGGVPRPTGAMYLLGAITKG